MVDPAGGGGAARRYANLTRAVIKNSHAPLAAHSVLGPVVALGLAQRAVSGARRPVDRVVLIVAIVCGMVRCLLDVRIVGHERPDILLNTTAVSAEKNV